MSLQLITQCTIGQVITACVCRMRYLHWITLTSILVIYCCVRKLPIAISKISLMLQFIYTHLGSIRYLTSRKRNHGIIKSKRQSTMERSSVKQKPNTRAVFKTVRSAFHQRATNAFHHRYTIDKTDFHFEVIVMTGIAIGEHRLETVIWNTSKLFIWCLCQCQIK